MYSTSFMETTIEKFKVNGAYAFNHKVFGYFYAKVTEKIGSSLLRIEFTSNRYIPEAKSVGGRCLIRLSLITSWTAIENQ